MSADEPRMDLAPDEPHPGNRTYLRVFLALLVFTVLEYLFAMVAQDHFYPLLAGLLSLAITKAALVAMFFMHLRFEGRWVYLVLLPAGVLATALVLALYPDIGWKSPAPPREPRAPMVQTTASPSGAPLPRTG